MLQNIIVNRSKYTVIVHILFIKHGVAIGDELLQNWPMEVPGHSSLVRKNAEPKDDTSNKKLITILSNK